VFVRGTDEGINLVARSFGGASVREGDEILVSHMEHHSNIVPWQILCESKKAEPAACLPIRDNGELELESLDRLLTSRTRLVSLVHLSNSLGTVNPVKENHPQGARKRRSGPAGRSPGSRAAEAGRAGSRLRLLCLSGHKLYGPTGIGVLYGKSELLEAMPPFMGGGDMISSVTFEKTLYNKLPYKFEAGTPHIAGAIALGAAMDYVRGFGLESIARHEEELLGTRPSPWRGFPACGSWERPGKRPAFSPS
jgi:cysteine desulfurase/selenocysteine lyase